MLRGDGNENGNKKKKKEKINRSNYAWSSYPRLTRSGGRTYVPTDDFRRTKFAGCIDNQIFLPMVLRCGR